MNRFETLKHALNLKADPIGHGNPIFLENRKSEDIFKK